MTPQRYKLLSALCPALFRPGQNLDAVKVYGKSGWQMADERVIDDRVVEGAIRDGLVTLKITEKGQLALQDEIKNNG